MTVLARKKIGVDRIRRHREGRSARVAVRSTASGAAVTTEATTSVKRRRREAGGMQDEAVYTCQCGFVFHAPVSTSVGCPHCGGAQAW
jgi:predicted Zn-ribbon and HTH transcriptional regulator